MKDSLAKLVNIIIIIVIITVIIIIIIIIVIIFIIIFLSEVLSLKGWPIKARLQNWSCFNPDNETTFWVYGRCHLTGHISIHQ